MEDKYKLFSQEFNCVLDLIDNYDSEFLSIYKKTIDNMFSKALKSIPSPAMEEILSNCTSQDQFKITLGNYVIEYMFLETGCTFTVTRKQPYFKVDVNIQAIYDEGITYLNMFCISVRNMKNYEDGLRVEYIEDENGDYKLIGGNMNQDKNAINFDYTVDLLKEDDQYSLIFKTWHRGAELSSKQIEITDEEVWECLDISEKMMDTCYTEKSDDDDYELLEDVEGYDFD